MAIIARGPDGPVRAIDLITDTLRTNGFLHDAAARIGVTRDTLRGWRTKGANVRTDLLAGRTRLGELTVHERHCVELSERMDAAETAGRMDLLEALTSIAKGGVSTVKITVVQDREGNEISRRTETAETLPSGRDLAWILSHRYPADFAGRVEVTGHDGGPIQVQSMSPVDKLVAQLERVGHRLAGSSGNGETAAVNGDDGT